jgi:tRNA A-37 threonylcarbamoyl transferase component Bud32
LIRNVAGDATIVSGRRVADRYRLVEPRGDDVWDAVDETLRRNVVIHLLRADADADEKARFAAEARSLARLNHRNVVATYDTGIDGDGTSYRVDENAGGEPLDLTAVANERRVSYAVQITTAMTDAHDRGLIHGRLTSGNVLVNDEGRVQVRGLRLPHPDDSLDDAKQIDIHALINLIAAVASSTASPLRELALGWRTDAPPSVASMLTELEAIPADFEPDLLSSAPPTPATGVPTTRRHVRPRHIIAATLVVAAALVAAVALPGRDADEPGGASGPLTVSATSFDPEATPPTENEAAARLAVDGDATTAWSTERYRSANFGNLKDGVGLVLRADSHAAFDQLTISSPSRGWDVEIYAAEQPAAALSGWGRPVASAAVESSDTTLELNGAEGGALLVWITDPGNSRQVRINEIRVQGRT